jgi:hypothetical protein
MNHPLCFIILFSYSLSALIAPPTFWPEFGIKDGTTIRTHIGRNYCDRFDIRTAKTAFVGIG